MNNNAASSSSSPIASPLPGPDYRVADRFFARLRGLTVDKVLPYQWEALNDRVSDAEPSGCIRNFRMVCGELPASEHAGFVFQDSDLYKWMEAAAFSLMWHSDAQLEERLESVVSLIARAQLPDGYVNTYYQLTDISRRWTNLKDHHELYCAGHLMEAAVAHYRATGRRSFLDVAKKFAQHIDSVFGPDEDKKHGYPGHEEIELALVKLYEVTGEQRWLSLARYFLAQRGQEPLYFREETRREGNSFYWDGSVYGYNYYQADRPLLEQQAPIGHAVRANYLYAGAAAAARCSGDAKLAAHLEQLWEEVTQKQMYVTGQVGSSAFGEAYTCAYDLPNDEAYAETCAGLALGFFAGQMLRLRRRGCYGDVLERVLYNGAVSGMDLQGTHFFYVNPLSVVPELTRKNQQKAHVKPVRQKWFSCACCPPNLARTLASLTDYAVSRTEDEMIQHLYVAGDYRAAFHGVPVAFSLTGNYPWEGEITLSVSPEQPVQFSLLLRVPDWARCDGASWTFSVNNSAPVSGAVLEDGYLRLRRSWQAGDKVTLRLPMDVRRVWPHPALRDDAGLVAVQRGPIVYCLEQADNGPDLHRVMLPRDAAFCVEGSLPGLPEDTVTLRCSGLERSPDGDNRLYRYAPPLPPSPRKLTWIPYYLWANRGEGEMRVWVFEK